MMEKIDIVLWVLGAGFTVTFSMMRMMWNSSNSSFDKQDSKFDKIDQDIKELRTSLNRMEGAFYSKDCCMLKEDKETKKAE